MRERDHKDDHARTSKRGRHAWLIAVLLALLAVGGWLLWVVVSSRDSRTADERLAEIEAARAMPDSENAAMIYNQLLLDPNAISVLDDFPESPAGDVLGRVKHEPWRSEDLPELAAWIKEHQYVIDRLLEACRLEKCRFPISIDIVVPASEMDRHRVMRQWGFLLAVAANNDLAAGRIDGSMAKWRCLLRIGSHLRQQPTVFDHIWASAITRLALESTARFVVAEDATELYLQEIEAMWLSAEDNWAECVKAVRLVENLRTQKVKASFGPVGRLHYGFASFRMRRAINSATDGLLDRSPLDESTNEDRCGVRGIQILVALKRHKIATSRWPHSLDEIKSSLPEESLTDPISKGAFVYRPVGGTFTLYSKGMNNIDENGEGEPDGGPDDWPIWPPREPNPNPKPSDANAV